MKKVFALSKGIKLQNYSFLDLKIGYEINDFYAFSILKKMFDNKNKVISESELRKELVNVHFDSFVFKECLRELIELNFVKEVDFSITSLFMNSIIWSNSKLLMISNNLVSIALRYVPIIGMFYLIAQARPNIVIVSMMYEYSIIHYFAISIHETAHAFVYWLSSRSSFNGFFSIEYLQFSFNYRHITRKSTFLTSISGSFFALFFLIIAYYLNLFNGYLILVEVFFQLVSLSPLSKDGKEAINQLKAN